MSSTVLVWLAFGAAAAFIILLVNMMRSKTRNAVSGRNAGDSSDSIAFFGTAGSGGNESGGDHASPSFEFGGGESGGGGATGSWGDGGGDAGAGGGDSGGGGDAGGGGD